MSRPRFETELDRVLSHDLQRMVGEMIGGPDLEVYRAIKVGYAAVCRQIAEDLERDTKRSADEQTIRFTHAKRVWASKLDACAGFTLPLIYFLESRMPVAVPYHMDVWEIVTDSDKLTTPALGGFFETEVLVFDGDHSALYPRLSHDVVPWSILHFETLARRVHMFSANLRNARVDFTDESGRYFDEWTVNVVPGTETNTEVVWIRESVLESNRCVVYPLVVKNMSTLYHTVELIRTPGIWALSMFLLQGFVHGQNMIDHVNAKRKSGKIPTSFSCYDTYDAAYDAPVSPKVEYDRLCTLAGPSVYFFTACMYDANDDYVPARHLVDIDGMTRRANKDVT